jgi:hypothetical protein
MQSSDSNTTIVKQYEDGTLKAVTLKNVTTVQIKGVRLCNTEKGGAVDRERSIANSVYRTKCRFYDIVHSMNVEWFGSLTFNPDYKFGPDRYNKEAVATYTKNQFKKFRVRAPDLQYIFVLEQHKDGAWHIHCVLGNIKGLSFEDANLKLYGRQVYHLIDWVAGFSDFSKTEDSQRCANYMLKYVTKDLCKDLSSHRFYASRNIPKPVKTVFTYDDKQNFFESPLTCLPVTLDPDNYMDGFIEDYFGLYQFRHEKKTEIESSFDFNLEIQTNYYKKVED